MSRIGAAVVATALLLGGCGGGNDAGPRADIAWEPVHTSAHWWMSVAAASPTEQWIVGGTTSQGTILGFDGSSITDLGEGLELGLLNWVHRFPDGSLIAVGVSGGVARSATGAEWSADDRPPTDQDLWGVWGATGSDVWAVGGGDQAVILRDTGSGFEPVAVPELERPGVDTFFKVWGSGPDDVYIVGQNGAVLHWDGSALSEVSVGTGRDLIGVWGTGPDRVVVVGGRSNAAAAVWDGSTWTGLDVGRFSGLNGVWVGDGAAYIVGNDGFTGIVDLDSLELEVTTVDTPVALHAVAGTGASLTAVGGDFATGPSGPFLGQVWSARR